MSPPKMSKNSLLRIFSKNFALNSSVMAGNFQFWLLRVENLHVFYYIGKFLYLKIFLRDFSEFYFGLTPHSKDL